MGRDEHFEALLRTLPKDQFDLYRSCTNIRSEDAYRGRTFIAYRMGENGERDARVIDKLFVEDFECTEDVGMSCVIRSLNSGRHVIRYTPVQINGMPFFVFLPLHAKLRWSTWPNKLDTGSLCFPLSIKVLSRRHRAEYGVVHLETGSEFHHFFPHIKT